MNKKSEFILILAGMASKSDPMDLGLILAIQYIIDKDILENRGIKIIMLFTFLFGGMSLFRALFSFPEGKGKAKV